MTLTIEATYENGTLKLREPLPLQEHEKVQVTLDLSAKMNESLRAVERTHGMIPWSGDSETLRRLAEDSEFGIMESP